jgi:hypothetical protein
VIAKPKVGDIVYYGTGTVPWTVKEVLKLRRGRRLVVMDLGWRGHERIEDAAKLFAISARYRSFYPADQAPENRGTSTG